MAAMIPSAIPVWHSGPLHGPGYDGFEADDSTEDEAEPTEYV